MLYINLTIIIHMQKYTHLVFATLLFILFNFILKFPIYMSVFAFFGALIPDIDSCWKFHRKLCHNIWFLIIILFFALKFNLIDKTVAIIFSIGFASHIFSDALTHKGVMPLWPSKKPKIHGPIKTGGFGEFLLMVLLLFIIFWLGRYVMPL